MNPIVSVIVPVYNAEKYLARCIHSILSQSFSSFELLLVDDGSTDGSLHVCQEVKDERIKVLHQSNEGVSSARNTGLDAACGEWVCFVDADDELLPGALQLLVDKTSEEVDLVMGGYEAYNECREVLFSVSERVEMVLNNDDALMQIYRPSYYKYLGYVASKLYRRSTIQMHNVRFASDIYYCEDALFLTTFMCASGKSVYFFTTPVYGYYVHDDSAMGRLGRHFTEKFLTDLDAHMRMKDEIETVYPRHRRLRKAARDGVYNSFRKIKGMLRSYKVRDSSLEQFLRKKTIRGIGVDYYCLFEVRQILRKLKHFV